MALATLPTLAAGTRARFPCVTAALRAALDRVGPAIKPGTIVLVSSQVPAGFTRKLADDRVEDAGIPLPVAMLMN